MFNKLIPFLLCCALASVTATAGTTYYVNPVDGSDAQNGRSKAEAWKSFKGVNKLELSAGDRIEITKPGSFEHSLHITGAGSRRAPIEVHFAPGRYDFHTTHLVRRKFNISNTNGFPDADKLIGIYFEGARHVRVSGQGARLVCRGKMMHVCIDRSEDIRISHLQFDYHRPTVSEFKVVETGEDYAVLKIHPDSLYQAENGQLLWVGEGWDYGPAELMQILDTETNSIRRSRNLLKGLEIEEIEPFLLRARGPHKFTEGWIYQLRETGRDYAGVFIRRSKDIVWKDVHFQFLHGMGVVSQFSENLTFDGVKIAPDPESGRTAAAWADGIHVSGCRGKIIVKDCFFSGLQDDAINIHGTHLQVQERVSEMQVKVRFMHEQTYGFMAFNPGDEVLFTRWDSLENYGPNRLKQAELLEPRVMLLTMEHPLPDDIHEKDALENITWTPEAEITGNTVMRVPTRGFLITTRRKVLVEDNCFYRTRMSAILVENDAKGWFESGPVRDLTIRDNRFHYCREPVIHINPRNDLPNPAVHRNIRILNNDFALQKQVAVKAKSTTGLLVKGNRIYADNPPTDKEAILTEDSAEITIRRNRYQPRDEWSHEFRF